MSRITDPDFKWTDSASTNVMDTWRKYGFKPTTAAERKARRKPKPVPQNVRPMKARKAA